METTILSLKTIYMMLMNEDFPMYSASVIGRNERKGYTMLRFWRRYISEDFRSLPYGKMFWKDEGKRNRYTSYLCNRSPEIRFYEDYARELAARIDSTSLLNQTQIFMQFLSERSYNHEILLRRIEELIRLTEAEDPKVHRRIAAQLQESLRWNQPGGSLFQAGYLLTLLTLYAAAGEAMDCAALSSLQTEDNSIGSLWKKTLQTKTDTASVSFLTLHSGLLQGNPLPSHRFFGREEELFDLREIAASGRKCIIRGMGGIGKTELLRQLIRICEEEQLVQKIAVVPYESGIIDSFGRCFPDFQPQEPERSFHAALFSLEKEAKEGKVLLLIDNLNSSPEEDPELSQLSSLPCSVIITTRNAELQGFEYIHLSSPAVSTGALIFRDNYGQPVTPEDQKSLAGMLEDDALCHPLTLRLMAKAARNKGWSVRQLQTQLESKRPLSWQEDERTVRLAQVYRQLYSYMQIPEECRDIAELFTLLPRNNYTLEFLQKWFPNVLDQTAQNKLGALVEGGWLDENETGFSMHPLIAQCLRRSVITEEKLAPMLETIQQDCLNRDNYVHAFYAEAAEIQRSEILVYMAGFLTGRISPQCLCALLRSVYMLNSGVEIQRQQRQLIDQMMKRCRDIDDEIQLLRLCVHSNHCVEMEQVYVATYEAQLAHLTVPKPLFMEFCVAAGLNLCINYQFAPAQRMLEYVISQDAAPMQKVRAYDSLIACAEYIGLKEDRLKWSEAGVACALAHPECGDFMLFMLLSKDCQSHIMFGHQQEAQTLLLQSEAVRNRMQNFQTLATYYDTKAMYEMSFGNLETAQEYYYKCLPLIEEYQGKHRDYYVLLGQIATISLQMKQYTVAVEEYEKVLTYAQQKNDTGVIQIFSNNIAVAYLELERPREALGYLDTALELARAQGGLAVGEAQRNRARAFRLMGAIQKEYACLIEAAPLLEESYGSEHPRTTSAKQRILELETSGIQNC